MDRQTIEQEARKLFEREIELDQKLFDSLQPASPEEIGEAAAELSADELLDRMRDTPSRETDSKLLRRAIDAVRAERSKVLRRLAAYDAKALVANCEAQRKEIMKREERQRKLLEELFTFEDLAPLTAGKLFAAIDPSGLLHVSKTRMLAQAVDAQEREAQGVANRDFSSGECSGGSVQDLITRMIDANEWYPQCGWRGLMPTFESVRTWYDALQETIRKGGNHILGGRIVYKLVWEHSQIVTKGKFNVQSGFTVERPRYTETIEVPAAIGPSARITEIVRR